MNKNRNPIFPLRLSPEHLKLLDKLAAQVGVTRTDVVRLALTEFAKKHLATGKKTI